MSVDNEIAGTGREETHVHDAAVDVAELLEAEQPRAVGGVIGEKVGARGLVEEVVGDHAGPWVCYTSVTANGEYIYMSKMYDLEQKDAHIPLLAFAMTLQRSEPKKYWLLSEKTLIPSGVAKRRSRSQPVRLPPLPKTRSSRVGKSLNTSEPVIHEPPVVKKASQEIGAEVERVAGMEGRTGQTSDVRCDLEHTACASSFCGVVAGIESVE